jgi:class 3 adenylate cyclase
MNCPDCQSPIEETHQFCHICGVKLQRTWPGLQEHHRPRVTGSAANADWNLKSVKVRREKRQKIASERKNITVLFADISGYTTLSERLDPEEVKDLVGHIIGEIAKVVIKNGGHIEKFAGDQVMAVFGIPLTHEEDPVRAVKTADEIHQVVWDLSHQVQETIG